MSAAGFAFVTVMESVDTPPAMIELGVNAFVTTGAVTAWPVPERETVFSGPAAPLNVSVPVLVPAAVGWKVTVTGQQVLARSCEGETGQVVDTTKSGDDETIDVMSSARSPVLPAEMSIGVLSVPTSVVPNASDVGDASSVPGATVTVSPRTDRFV